MKNHEEDILLTFLARNPFVKQFEERLHTSSSFGGLYLKATD